MKKDEYRVRPVVRYIVTRHTEVGTGVMGEFDNEFYAECAAEALNGHDFKVGTLVSDSYTSTDVAGEGVLSDPNAGYGRNDPEPRNS